jgi:hypothetical protein
MPSPVKQILYSFPPGSGGDHVCAMLMNQPLRLEGYRAHSAVTIRHAEHQVRIGKISLQHYLDELRCLRRQQPVIINCHEIDMPGRDDMVCVRAVWSDPRMTLQWVCRDIILNSWQNDVMPYITGNMRKWLTDIKISERRRILDFLMHQMQHGPWKAEEPSPLGWHRFYLDRIFTQDFVDDVMALADVLHLEVDRDQANSNHQQWLSRNQPRDFTPRQAVRYLEAAGVLDLL